jgi:cytochrome c oxidase assembly protein subunit 15
MFWLALSLLRPCPALPAACPSVSRRCAAVRRFTLLSVALVVGQAPSGSLVAGIRAGFAYNTFPLMNGRLVPPEILSLAPWYRNFADNMATVQFDHRAIAWLLALLIPVFWLVVRSQATAPHVKLAANLLLAALLLQLALGIATLLLVVPVPLAAAHRPAPCRCSPPRSMPRMRCARARATRNQHERWEPA